MKLSVIVKTNARKNEVVRVDDSTFRVAVTASPIEGKANKAVIELLAEYFDAPKSSVYIHTGIAGRKKIIEIDEDILEERGNLQQAFRKEITRLIASSKKVQRYTVQDL